MSETRKLFESIQNNLNESKSKKLSFEEYKDLYDPYCNLTDEELKQMYELDKDELYTDEDIEQIKKDVENTFNTNESALKEDSNKKDDVKIINVEVASEHKPNREYDVRYKTPADIVYYGYATIYTDKLGEFTVSFDDKYKPRTDGFPWEFLQEEKLTDEQINFINSHKAKISNLIYKANNNGGILKEDLKEDDSFYNELEVTNYRPTGQDEGALANMIIKSKFGDLEVNLLYLDGEYKIVTPNMLRTKEEEELINNLVNEYGMQELIDFAADYHYKKSHIN